MQIEIIRFPPYYSVPCHNPLCRVSAQQRAAVNSAACGCTPSSSPSTEWEPQGLGVGTILVKVPWVI